MMVASLHFYFCSIFLFEKLLRLDSPRIDLKQGQTAFLDLSDEDVETIIPCVFLMMTLHLYFTYDINNKFWH